MVMTSDGTQIQILTNWPLSHAKRVTRDSWKSLAFRNWCVLTTDETYVYISFTKRTEYIRQPKLYTFFVLNWHVNSSWGRKTRNISRETEGGQNLPLAVPCSRASHTFISRLPLLPSVSLPSPWKRRHKTHPSHLAAQSLRVYFSFSSFVFRNALLFLLLRVSNLAQVSKFSVFTSHVIRTKHRNSSMNKVKNLGYYRWGLCCFSFARYLQKCVTQIERALYGDAMFVSFLRGTNMAAVK